MTTYFLNTNYSPKCLSSIKEELEDPKWYISPFGVERSDLSKDFKAYIQSLLPFKISDAGFLRRRPRSMYHPHTDPKRTFALNMLLTDGVSDDEGTFVVKTQTYDDNGVQKFLYATHEKVDYTKDCFTVLNVKKIHYVVNHTDHDRIILSIGCNGISYQEFIGNIEHNLKDL